MSINNESRIIHISNDTHLGDNIFVFVMFYNIKDYIEKNNIFIKYYCHTEYISQVSEFNMTKNVNIFPIENKPNDGTKIYNAWIGSHDYPYNFFSSYVPYMYSSGRSDFEYFDIFLCKFYNNLLKVMNIPIEMKQFLYDDPDLHVRCVDINKKTNNKYRNIEVIFCNCEPRSGQLYDYDVTKYNDFAYELSEKYNIVTTEKVENILCTRDDNLSIKDIAAVSTNIKKIIAVNSGVITALYNTYIINNPNIIIYTIDKDHKYSYSNCVYAKGINDLMFLLEENPLNTSTITNVDNFVDKYSIYDAKVDKYSIYDAKVKYYSMLFYCFIILFLLSIIVSILYKNKRFMSRISLRM